MSGCLLADIGGTHARFAVFGDATLGDIETISTGAYANAIDGIRHVLSRWHNEDIDSAVIAAAGPVESGRCALTNAPWILNSDEIKRLLRFRTVKVVNDLEALAWGVPGLVESDLARIGNGHEVRTEPVAVIAPGTGLGMACFIPGGDRDRVLVSEGGHATLASTSEAEAEAVAFLHRRHGHVSAERALSGRGLTSLFEVLAEPGKCPPVPTPEEIVRAAVEGSSETARKALDMFCAFLGSVAGNAALTFGARGGVLIAGGIAPQIVEYVRRSDFRAHFESKGRFRGYLERIPTAIVMRRDPTFVGLMTLAAGLDAKTCG